MEEDKSFIIFPSNLPKGIVDIETLSEEVDEWLNYFPQAKLRIKVGDLYTPLLIRLSQPFPKFIKKVSPWCKEKKFGLWQSCLQSEKPISMDWLLFLTNTMDTEMLQQAITENLQDIPMGLQWKMISLGIQGQVKLEDQVHALHINVDKMDVAMAKPLLMEMYPSQPSEMHKFPLHIHLQLVLELDMVLNIKSCKNIDKLQACQNTWSSSKLVFIKTWEIELLDSQNMHLFMSLRDVMMTIWHPSNEKFALFHSINKSR